MDDYNRLIAEFTEGLSILKWSVKIFFDEFYNDPTSNFGSILTENEIALKYKSYRTAKSRKTVNIHELKQYVEYIHNHDDFKNSQYIYATYIPLGNLDSSTERSLKKSSRELTKKLSAIEYDKE